MFSYFKFILSLLSILFLLQSRITAAEHISLVDASPTELKSVLDKTSLSSSTLSAIENCKDLEGENRRACMEIFSETENESVLQPQLSPLENCKVFSGEQFRICVEMYMLEEARLKKSSSSEFCKRFTGKTYRLCSEMPMPIIEPKCKACAAEKLRFCMLVYLPTTDTANETNTFTSSTLESITEPSTTPLSTTKIKDSTTTASDRDTTTVPIATYFPTASAQSTVAKPKTKRRRKSSSHTTPTAPITLSLFPLDRPKIKRKNKKSTADPVSDKTSLLTSTFVPTASPLPVEAKPIIQLKKIFTAAPVIADCKCHHDHAHSEKKAEGNN